MSPPFLKAELLTASMFSLDHSRLRSFQATKNWKHACLNIYKGDVPSRFISNSRFQHWLSKWPTLPAELLPAHPSARFVQINTRLSCWPCGADFSPPRAWLAGMPCRSFTVSMSHRKNPAGYLGNHLGLWISRMWESFSLLLNQYVKQVQYGITELIYMNRPPVTFHRVISVTLTGNSK